MHPITDPELLAGLALMQQLFPDGLEIENIESTRALLAKLQAKRPAPKPSKLGMAQQDYQLPRLDGIKGLQPFMTTAQLSQTADSSEPFALTSVHADANVTVRLYRPLAPSPTATHTKPLPVLLWLHGGGFMLGELAWDDRRCLQMVQAFGCAVLAVDYRLAPEHPYPAALVDSYSALCWLKNNASALELDASRIAVAGISAGGGLAASLALLSRDLGFPSLCAQLLLSPMLDDRTVLGGESQTLATAITPGWSLADNSVAWQRYVFGHAGPSSPGRLNPLGDGDPNGYVAAHRAESLQQLPSTFLGVGSVDLFQPECSAYAVKLQRAGVPTDLRIYPDAFHGFDSWASQSRLAKQWWADQAAFLTLVFATK